ncbi:MAG: hypothetical protein FP825_01530 [Hyphomonas sp.]|uniref:hypothetical protein n=1 Tax=Hyphomonas sp. TaxID=87 RepID=UPI00180E5AC0|nr:hypothetical protein [Hyphomonas sp.]MBU3921236.1 DUF1543 domain-containing protein [Alphaproteobacteria bacterium]MBA3067145.1 hypothetical protein [Hyphomonas sp.]MBU4063059.1 DUF1543 domain-containing protein [Alphaproteobacteria bacterium]MBU4164376.1 DUF1543 domain-containing protein [Alphaproteobacteria bacterium]MBU4568838.1 DUF1543 domain-containing protein [Alphaproteobacteria bacterium]
MKLFAVFVGGSHARANIELHDLRFVAAGTLADTVALSAGPYATESAPSANKISNTHKRLRNNPAFPAHPLRHAGYTPLR